MTAVTPQAVPFLDLDAMHREIAGELDASWRETTDSGAFVGGPAVGAFEGAWADYCATRHAVGVANGTDALTLALRALDIGRGEEVVVPANTFVATVEAVMLAGAIPRFVDVEPDTLLMSTRTVEPALGPRTGAIVAVDLFGGLPDMDALSALAAHAGVPMVEDAAQAHGAEFRGRRAGSFGIVGCFSFYPGKNLGAFGDAGAVVTDDPDLAGRVRSLADHGRDPRDKYLHPRVGTNSRLDGLQAAVLHRKLPRLDAWNAGRREAMARYREHLVGAEPLAAVDGVHSVHHLAVVRVPKRDEVRARLAERGVQTGIHYPIPCHRQPAYRRYATGALRVAECASSQILSLPMYPHLTGDQVDQVCATLRDVLRAVSDGR